MTGDVHFTCWMRCGLNSPWPSDSGEANQTKFGEPVSDVVPVQLRQTGCSSHDPSPCCAR